MTTENNKKAGDAWFAYIEKFPKLKEYFNGMGELAALYFAQQIDIFAGKYPATPPSIEGEIKSKEDWEYQAKALSAIKKGMEIALKDAMEECERLAGLVKFWQEKYYELNAPMKPGKIDNL